MVEGRLKLDSWEDREGGTRSKFKVALESFQFVESATRETDGGDSAVDASGSRAFPSSRPKRENGGPDLVASSASATTDDKVPF